MSSSLKKVNVVFPFVKTHNDELSLHVGDTITVTQKLDGGWWEGTLDGQTGWFPSNYVKEIVDNDEQENKPVSTALVFQKEIIQHILESEIKFCNNLADVLYNFIGTLETTPQLPFPDKVQTMKSALSDLSGTHRSLLSALHDVAHQSNTFETNGSASTNVNLGIGHIFLSMASELNERHVAYGKLHLVFITLYENFTKSTTPLAHTWELSKLKQQLAEPQKQIHNFGLLLHDMHRYMEDSNPDRGDVQRAAAFFVDLNDNLLHIHKMKERDLDILVAKIHGLPASEGATLASYGEPLFTSRVVSVADVALSADSSAGQQQQQQHNTVLVLFPDVLMLLACTADPDTYRFQSRWFCRNLTVRLILNGAGVSIQDSSNDAQHKNYSILFTDQNVRNTVCQLLVQCGSILSSISMGGGGGSSGGSGGTVDSIDSSSHMQLNETIQLSIDSSHSLHQQQQQPHLSNPLPPSSSSSSTTDVVGASSASAAAAGAGGFAHPPAEPQRFIPPPNIAPLTEQLFSLRLDPPVTVFARISGDDERATSLLNSHVAPRTSAITNAHRKKAERQKSAINPEDIEKSIQKRDSEVKRMEDDTNLLKYVEWFYSQMTARQNPAALDLTKLRLNRANTDVVNRSSSSHQRVQHHSPPPLPLPLLLPPQSISAALTTSNMSFHPSSSASSGHSAQANFTSSVVPPPVMLPTRAKKII